MNTKNEIFQIIFSELYNLKVVIYKLFNICEFIIKQNIFELYQDFMFVNLRKQRTLQKSHLAQSSVRLQASQSPHIRADFFLFASLSCIERIVGVIYHIPCSYSLRLLGSLWGSLGTYGMTQKLGEKIIIISTKRKKIHKPAS